MEAVAAIDQTIRSEVPLSRATFVRDTVSAANLLQSMCVQSHVLAGIESVHMSCLKATIVHHHSPHLHL